MGDRGVRPRHMPARRAAEAPRLLCRLGALSAVRVGQFLCLNDAHSKVVRLLVLGLGTPAQVGPCLCAVDVETLHDDAECLPDRGPMLKRDTERLDLTL